MNILKGLQKSRDSKRDRINIDNVDMYIVKGKFTPDVLDEIRILKGTIREYKSCYSLISHSITPSLYITGIELETYYFLNTFPNPGETPMRYSKKIDMPVEAIRTLILDFQKKHQKELVELVKREVCFK